MIERTDDVDMLLDLNNCIRLSKCANNRKQLEQLERIYNFQKEHPEINVQDVLSRKILLTQAPEQTFNMLNAAIFGEKPKFIKIAEAEFERETGVKIHFQYNTGSMYLEDNIYELKNAIERYKETGRNLPTDIYMTDLLIPDGNTGYFQSSGHDNNLKWFIVLRTENSDKSIAARCFFHETVHLSDLNNIQNAFYDQPVGAKYMGLDENKQVIIEFNQNEAEQIQAKAAKYISRYSSNVNIDEFKAEFGSMLLMDRIAIESVEFENGSPKCKVKIKNPYINLNGVEIKIDAEAIKDIEELALYYISLGGQDFSRRITQNAPVNLGKY